MKYKFLVKIPFTFANTDFRRVVKLAKGENPASLSLEDNIKDLCANLKHVKITNILIIDRTTNVRDNIVTQNAKIKFDAIYENTLEAKDAESAFTKAAAEIYDTVKANLSGTEKAYEVIDYIQFSGNLTPLSTNLLISRVPITELMCYQIMRRIAINLSKLVPDKADAAKLTKIIRDYTAYSQLLDIHKQTVMQLFYERV